MNSYDKQQLVSNEVEMGPVLEVKNINYVKEKIVAFLGLDQVQNAVSVKWILLHGNKYSCGKSLIISDVLNNSPEFVMAKKIYVVNSSLYYFECQPLLTIEWSDQYLSHEVEVPNQAQANVFGDAENLIDYTSYMSVWPSETESIFQ